jgi:hypothetical protein
MLPTAFQRRDFLRLSLGGLGLSLPNFLQASDVTSRFRRTCIVLYCWGGMSHHETLDTKPNAPSEYRGEFNPIDTVVPGIQVGEHLPRLAQHTYGQTCDHSFDAPSFVGAR